MNIETLLNKANLFDLLVVNSGFKRDLSDYFSSIQQSQNQNLVYMKDLSEKIKSSFQNFENNSLNNDLNYLLKDSVPFTEGNLILDLNQIDSDGKIDANQYYNKFYEILRVLIENINENENEINSVKKTLIKYSTHDSKGDSEKNNALISIIFKDLKSTGTLKEFTRSLTKWNRALVLYHTLLKSDSPDEIDLVEIQNGSIDVVCNLDLDVSIDLTKVIITGLKVYGAYLLYKSKMAREIIASYMGNKKLIDMEKEREKLMLTNILESVKTTIEEQHKENLKVDKKISKEGVQKKIEEVSKVITEHIVMGNEVKLLTYVEPPQDDESEDKSEKLSDNLRENTSVVRERFNQLEITDKQLLIDFYSFKADEENETLPKK